MIERKEKSYVHCPVCDKLLMKCFGNSEIVIRCGKCNRDIMTSILGAALASKSPRFQSKRTCC